MPARPYLSSSRTTSSRQPGSAVDASAKVRSVIAVTRCTAQAGGSCHPARSAGRSARGSRRPELDQRRARQHTDGLLLLPVVLEADGMTSGDVDDLADVLALDGGKNDLVAPGLVLPGCLVNLGGGFQARPARRSAQQSRCPLYRRSAIWSHTVVVIRCRTAAMGERVNHPSEGLVNRWPAGRAAALPRRPAPPRACRRRT